MAADEALAIGDGFQQCFLPLRRHGRVIVAAFLGQVHGGLEEEGIVLADRLRQELAAVLGAGDLEAVFLAQAGHDPFRQRQLVVLAALHDGMLKALRTREHEHVLLAAVRTSHPAEGKMRQTQRGGSGAASHQHLTTVHHQ